MFVCGGLTICWIVCCGVTTVLRKLRICAGRHCAKAPRSKPPTRRHRHRPPPPSRPPPWLGAAGAAPPLEPCSFCDAGPDLVLLGLAELEAHAPGDGQPLAAGLDLGDDLRHRAVLVDGGQDEPGGDRRDARERRDLLCLALRERELRARQEEGVVEVRSGLAELGEVGERRLVRRERLAGAAEAPPPPPPKPPPPPPPPKPPPPCRSAARASPSGRCRSTRAGSAPSSARGRARARARRSTITSATPIESPSSVRIVRPLRRVSSLRRYER